MATPQLNKTLPPAESEPRALPALYAEMPSLEGETDFGYYYSLLARYRWRILTFVLLVTAIATLIALVLPKQYSSTAILRIDPSGIHTVGESASNQNGIPLSSRRLIATESKVILSPAVVLKTIRTLRLYRYKQFAPLHLGPNAITLSTNQMNQVLGKVTKSISINQPLGTYLLQVSFRSFSPDLSAQTANSLLQSLIAHDYSTRVRALMGSSQSMRAQLISLRAKMERSQTALIHYESRHDVLNPDSKNNIMLARLSQVNQDLGIAQTKRMALQADYEIVQTGNLDALIASDRGPYLLPLYQRVLNDQRHLTRMAQVYGPNYPIYKQQVSLIRSDRKVLRAQEQHIARQIRAQYAMALAREKLLRSELELQKKRMDAFNLKAIRYYALKAASDSYTRLYYLLQQRIQDAQVAANLHAESLRIISPARPDQVPVYPRPLLTAVLAFFLSSLLAVGTAIAVGALDKSVSSPEQVEHFFHLPVLSSLAQVAAKERRLLSPKGYGSKLLEPSPGAGSAAGKLSSAFREGILSLHSALLLAQDRDLHTLAITSSVPSEGKSTICANLAAAMAGLGARTILADTDMRKPSMHRQFQISNQRGLSTVLRGQCSLEQAIVNAHDIPNLSLLPAGPNPASPAELLHSGLGDLLEQLQNRFDFVLLDCPPILGFADTLTMANRTQGCLLVVRAGETERQLVGAALRQLRAARAQILGIILNNVSQELGSYYSYYGHYYKYYRHADAETEPREKSHEDEI